MISLVDGGCVAIEHQFRYLQFEFIKRQVN